MAATLPTLDNFLSHMRQAAAVFDAAGRLASCSPRFLMLFSGARENESYDAAFASCPLLGEKLRQVSAEKTSFSLHETPLFPEMPATLFNVEIFPLLDADSGLRGTAVSVFEASNRSAFSEQKKRADSLSRLGLIAAGLAHEIRNPLSGLKGAAELIVADADDPARLKSYAGIIARESDRIDRLVRELLDFSKPREIRLRPVNLNRLLHEVGIVAGINKDKKLSIKEAFDPSLPDIPGDEDALRQVFLNLVKNAAEACASGGTVTLSSQVVTDVVLKTDEGKRRIVGVKVRDDGAGMDEEELRNIFTPYYSTKQGGTGLGLAIVNKLVELHGGSVTVRSRKGEGTVFSVFLPL